MPPLDALSVDTGAFVSESAFSVGSQTNFMGGESSFLADAENDFQRDRPIHGAIEFRVIRSGLPVRRLRLTGNRYTFGSADGCSIQLNDPSLRPMHAVLIRDANRILVRAYSVPLELNDTRTTEASIQAGDVIRLGAYSFELLPTAAPKSDRSYPSSLAASRSTHDDPTLWREQLRREVAQWRARQAECDRREGRCDDRETVLRNRESELWSRAEQLHRRESHLMAQESAALQIQEDYTSKHQELLRLRDENRAKQQAYEARESEFHQLEQEYREHVEEASRQLQQSQQQAEAATQSVQRMREQFADLNHQLQELQEQQADLLEREEKKTSEHQRLRLELEAARDAAVDERAEEIVRRQEIEHRIDEMDAQLRQVQAECDAERKRADESQEVAQKLREQIEQLHENIRQAGDEATQLRRDYEQACDSVRSLEAIVEQGNARGEMDRESWYGEAEQLRQSVEQLSIDLARANGELGDLRKVNEELSDRLDGLTRERDEALDEVASRPTQDAFESLRDELRDANDKLAKMQRDYEETLARLESVQHERISASHGEQSNESSSRDAVSAIPTDDVAWTASDTDDGVDEAIAEATEPSFDMDLQENLAEQSYDRPVDESQTEVDALPDESVVLESDTQVEEATDAPQPESRSFTASTWDHDDETDDKPQWSTEPMQKTEAPHFDTGESESWNTSDAEPQDHVENFEAEFDRAGEQDSADDRYTSDNESVDNVIDLIEQNVDEAMAVDVTAETDSVADSLDDQPQPIPASPWGYDANDDEKEDRNPQPESDVTSPWSAADSFAEEADSFADEADSFADENEPSAVETDSALVAPWQPVDDDSPSLSDDENASLIDDEPSRSLDEEQESVGLAGQLIRDLESSTEDADDSLPSDNTYPWENAAAVVWSGK